MLEGDGKVVRGSRAAACLLILTPGAPSSHHQKDSCDVLKVTRGASRKRESVVAHVGQALTDATLRSS
jgi:hypothetical protein